MNPDLRLLPLAATAWAGAILAIHLPTIGQLALALAALIAVVLALRRSPLLLAAMALLAVGLSAAVQSTQFVACEGEATVAGRAQGKGLETRIGSNAPARLSLRVETVDCGSGPTPAGGTLVLLGEVDGVARDTRIVASGRMLEVERGGDAHALLLDAEIHSTTPSTGLVGIVAERREAFLDLTSRLSPQGRGLVPGMTFGDDSALSDTLDEAMKRTSLSHLTAISGSHITMLLAVVLLLTMRASQWWRAGLLLISLVALLLLVGPEPSVVRAGAMATVGAIALARGRPPQAMPALSVGIAVLMILDPWRSTSLGFALSVSASAALVLVVPRLVRRVPEKHVWRRRIVAVSSVPLVAHLACAPIIVLFSPAVSLSSVLANVLVTPVVPLATGAGMLGLLAVQWEPAAMVFLRLSEAATWWIAEVAITVSRLPWSTVPWPGGWGGALVLGALSVVALVALAGPAEPRGQHAKPRLSRVERVRRSSRNQGPHRSRTPRFRYFVSLRSLSTALWAVLFARAAIFALVAAALATTAFIAFRLDPWVVWQCDVGQGTSTLIRSGARSAIMVDVGLPDGRSQDCLTRAGIAEIDLLVITHPHADHGGNVAAILAAAPVRDVLVSPVRTPIADRIDDEFESAGIAPRIGSVGLSGESGTASWTVLWPESSVPYPDDGDGPGANDASVVLLIEVDGQRIVPLGDLEDRGQAGLAKMTRACGAPCRDVDIAVVAHHGSRTQSDELAALLSPSIALIGVGENSYGHPAPETIELYESVGAVILRTDTDGDIKVGK